MRTVVLVEDDEQAARQLERDLTSFGFQMRILDHPAALREAVAEAPPAAVILDVVFAGDDRVGTDVVTLLRGDGALDCPVVFLSERDDLRARLASVRAGCDGYLVKPANIADIVDLLDRLTLGTDDEAFRVLVVDDDAEVVRHTELILKEAGMITAIVDDPMKILEPLEEFPPWPAEVSDGWCSRAHGFPEEVSEGRRFEGEAVDGPGRRRFGEDSLDRCVAADNRMGPARPFSGLGAVGRREPGPPVDDDFEAALLSGTSSPRGLPAARPVRH